MPPIPVADPAVLTPATASPGIRQETAQPIANGVSYQGLDDILLESVPPPDTRVQELPVTDPWDQLRQLPHYDADYPYAPFRYRYERHHTTDPNYIVENVTMPQDSWQTLFVERAGPCLVAWGEHQGQKWRYTVEAGMYHIAITGGIPAAADIALWHQGQIPEVFRSPDHRVTGNPLLGMESVSHGRDSTADNDWGHKMRVYAQMGIAEYWLFDPERSHFLHGFRQSSAHHINVPHPDNHYVRVPRDENGVLYSEVLDTWVHWDQGLGEFLCWDGDGDSQNWFEPRRALAKENFAAGQEAGVRETRLNILASVLGAQDMVLIKATWRPDQPDSWATDDQVMAVVREPERWQEILLPHQ